MKDGRRTTSEPGERRASPLERVRKRDGREVPFDRAKIRDAIAAAMDAVGDDDPLFAAEVAGVVELALADRAQAAGGGTVPAIEEIQDLVERALMDLGRPAVAKAYILYRDRRARLRAALHVHSRARGPLRVREPEGLGPWSKGRIVAALVEEAELARPQAEEIAAAVERRVFASGWKRISTGLVRELVASELFERGWTQALRRQEAIALGRADLRRLLERGAAADWEPEARAGAAGGAAASLGGECLARFALEELLPEEIAELHRAGDLHVEDLRACDRPLVLSLEAELLAGPGEDGPRRLAGELAQVAGAVAREIVLEEPLALLAHLPEGALEGWLDGLCALACAAGLRLGLSARERPAAGLPEALLRALAAAPAARAPRLYLAGRALEQELAHAPERAPLYEELLAAERLVPAWGDREQDFVAPGCHRRRGERGAIACLGAVALDLPRLARRSGAWREDLFQGGLTELVRAALEVARALERFQRRARRALPFARASFALVPVGLREALRVLGDGAPDADQGARALGLLAEAAARFADADTPTCVPTPFFGARAARRFAWLDARRAAEESGRQSWLFAEAAGEGEPCYTHGFALAGPRGAGAAPGRLEAELLRTLPAGACAPVPGAAEEAALREAEPRLSAWKRFELLRRAHAGEVELELFPAPRLARPRETRPAPLRPLR